MELKQAIYGRRSVREFTTAPVGRDMLLALIDAAVQAPSAVNQQPWAFCVVEDKSLLTHISHEAKAYMLATTPAALMSHHFSDVLGNADFDIFYHAPALILVSSVVESPWAVENCALAAENLMLAAYGLGLGTCWIGFAQAWLGTPAGKTALGLPQTYVPVAPIIVGHPKSAPPAVPRREPQIRWIG